jgi:hypothetical protein
MDKKLEVSLPLDLDGFMRRECPACEQEFKWHHGRTDEAPADYVYPAVYWCPRCGASAAHDQWWTPAQLAYVKSAAVGPLMDEVADSLFGGISNSGHLKVTRSSNRHEIPDPLVEADDMIIVEPPCHPWEPVKVPEDAHPPFYCLICGEAFTV